MANEKVKFFTTDGDFQRMIEKDAFKPIAVVIANESIGVIHENYLFIFDNSLQFMKKILLQHKVPSESLTFTYCLTGSKEQGFVVGNIPNEKDL